MLEMQMCKTKEMKETKEKLKIFEENMRVFKSLVVYMFVYFSLKNQQKRNFVKTENKVRQKSMEIAKNLRLKTFSDQKHNRLDIRKLNYEDKINQLVTLKKQLNSLSR
jgi:hypothetical protein